MRRRTFIALLSVAGAWPLAARAQQTKIPRIGVVWIGSPEHESVVLGSLRKALAADSDEAGHAIPIGSRPPIPI